MADFAKSSTTKDTKVHQETRLTGPWRRCLSFATQARFKVSGYRVVKVNYDLLLQIFGFRSQCGQQRRRQFGIAFLDSKLLAIGVDPFEEIVDRRGVS
jgi:hypothetical protein